MLSKISAVTAFLAGVVNVVVLLGWWDITPDQVAGVNGLILLGGTVVHSWFNPAVPVGKTE